MSRAVLSIGSNLGDRLGYLRSVIDGFGARVVAVSPVYSTAPWGGVEQDDYLNAVVVVEDPAFGCIDWLRRGQELERAAERVREVRWGARTLDVDVVWCAEDGRPCRSDDPELVLPHPQAHRRAFVLVPWLEVEPDAELEVDGRTHRVRDLLAGLDAAEREGVHRTDLTLTRGGAGKCSS
ncbi:2-amino-4-hydroxy-6-hydroxymethyldihydropteridine diphosphokinase [Nocardia cyriacigeorgica]|jgi:2-amino-4-hydroxy-6-hydroxymethyldihydropteridine diphosphokinase|uniref:2-amino-4-hydroxy-6- hydroxymethyldihydropteridine diphosphokinase n=1 Tax=Nocardia cyriacigeorgica TaxID=135487 RepID=UPI0002FBC017|nr:2-amino-4-hydroxy-6-hydroxymethyldihydropteridine diphosphokinase [Nocardia cyriacigeorgica]AVH21150.1 2-amino-4-hydroxy-6-hydroxymethyldihydropteridine diphosphokinase [Nocardia cyriacigeorgica]MBF6324679.1 2-amino-4-hydroxy-6-hydroxymethyldihydropteridine diphosphokinase [Nocardia cyriacigeorgica]MBF6499345.1 2-amino-4-hydroxy-6-hydroxymethyldihydropteridine diphosphokinase [Nocardia cyriacigeorgica]PPJ07575.1 2-amino-4-hydroxy-6-hydroxymethyldihydropteridine diphosphokinase [Nocardia cyri